MRKFSYAIPNIPEKDRRIMAECGHIGEEAEKLWERSLFWGFPRGRHNNHSRVYYSRLGRCRKPEEGYRGRIKEQRKRAGLGASPIFCTHENSSFHIPISKVFLRLCLFSVGSDFLRPRP